MNWLKLNYLNAMHDSLVVEARTWNGDFEQQALLLAEARLYEKRIDREWQQYAQYDGGGVVPARYRNAREGVDGRRAL